MTLVALALGLAQATQPNSAPSPADAKPAIAEPKREANEAAPPQRQQLNLLGQTDTQSGESRRNENQQFNQIDTNLTREMNLRIGTTTTVVPEFRPDASYFGSEYGGAPIAAIHYKGAFTPARRPRITLNYGHNNSLLSARAFFQVGGVQPARENDYGFQSAMPIRRSLLSIDGRQQKLRGQVNGNVLVPLPTERTPLATDAGLRAIVERYLAAYPRALPNRTDIDPRMLNTNAPQQINTSSTGARWDIPVNDRHRLYLSHSYLWQAVKAFQLVAGQNPDTDTRSNSSRVQWSRNTAGRGFVLTSGFDRVTTFIRPAGDSIGPTVGTSNFIAGLSPAPPIPIVRASNRFRQAAQWLQVRGSHTITFGGEISRNQVNGREQDGERGIVTFANDFGRDAVSNFRFGTPSLFTIALGNTHRGFRNWFAIGYAGDQWRVHSRFTIDAGVRYEIASRPVEVNGFDRVPYPCDCNNVAPRFGVAYRLPSGWGRFRAAYGIHFGEIFATTYGQTRLNPPGNFRIAIPQPDLRNPTGGISIANLPPNLRSGFFIISPDMVTPYAHQYNASWETDLRGGAKMQLGYVGSRAMKLFQMWFENRANPLPGFAITTATINQRRASTQYLEVFRLLNASRGYYDAARATVILPRKAGLSGEVAYWFSKALDLGNDYTATLAGVDARQGRSQAEAGVHADMRGRSIFDQPHAFLMRGSYDIGKMQRQPAPLRSAFGGWTLSAVILAKNGTPFTVESGSDAPGFGNVDGQGSDRPHILDPSILGRTIGDPDTSASLLPKSAFAFMRPGELRGSLGRNTFRRGRIANVNASLARRWQLAGDRALNFRVESINFLNTPQFSEPIREVASPSFGRIVNTLNDGRTFRFQLRLDL